MPCMYCIVVLFLFFLMHPTSIPALLLLPQAVLTDPARLKTFVEHYPDVIRKIVATQPALGAMLQQRLGPGVQLPR